MANAKKEIYNYIRLSLERGNSFKKIKESLIERGYPMKAAEGIILSYRYRGNILKWLTVSLLIFVFVISIYLSGSGIVGLVTLNYKQSYGDEIGLVVNESSSYSWYPSSKGIIKGIALTGNIIGEGDTQVYIENNDKKYLILDSSNKNIKMTEVYSSVLGKRIKHFDMICEETCFISGFNQSIYNLVFEIDDSILEIEKIDYDIALSDDMPSIPEFLEIPNIESGLGGSVEINLSSYFNASEDSFFSYVGEEGGIEVNIDGDVAIINANDIGKWHAYFVARVNNVEFMSNLVEINVQSGKQGKKMHLQGPVVRPSEEIIEQESPINHMGILLLVIIVLVVIILVIIPGRYFDMTNLANKIDKIRKNGSMGGSLKEYNEIKSKIGKAKGKEKEKLMDELHNNITHISSKLHKSKKLDDFFDKAKEFENAKGKKKREIYDELQKIYIKIIESKIGSGAKKDIYKRMQSYYKELK